MREIIVMERKMALENIFGMMVLFILEIGRVMLWMDMEFIIGLMVE